MDRCQHDALPKVADVCPDNASVLALSVTRFIAAGYMTGDVACWDAAYNSAEQVQGVEEAPAFLATMIGVMRAIRAERAADWSFMPAACCRVTLHEQDLMDLLALSRSAPAADLPRQAARLAGVAAAPRLTRAPRLAAGSLDRAQRQLAVAAEGARGAPERPAASFTVH
jgi:hypothetical protein